MAETIRAFIAVALSAEVKQELARVSRALAESVPARAVRWVTPERMHLTLHFLGKTAVTSFPSISAGLDQVCERIPPFILRLDGLGCFPNRKRPRVIWVGLRGDLRQLGALKREIDEMLAPLGWEQEGRPFRAHMTLGRVKDRRMLSGMRWGVEMKKVRVGVTAVHLIESQLLPAGPEYTIRHTSQLKK